MGHCLCILRAVLVVCALFAGPATAQTPPSASEVAAYGELHAAGWRGDIAALQKLIAQKTDLAARDGNGRTALHVAAFASRDEAVRALAEAGADLNALDRQSYDVVTIAAVANDVALLDLVLKLGASARNISSPYEGTALIAAAHLGHHEVVKSLIAAGAPLDHVNNLGWTALIEAVILGTGGAEHTATVRALVAAGANSAIADRQGMTPLDHAKARGYGEMIRIIEAGANKR